MVRYFEQIVMMSKIYLQIELIPGSGVFIDPVKLALIRKKAKRSVSKMVRSLLDVFFRREQLALACVGGRSTHKQALDYRITETIRGIVFVTNLG